MVKLDNTMKMYLVIGIVLVLLVFTYPYISDIGQFVRGGELTPKNASVRELPPAPVSVDANVKPLAAPEPPSVGPVEPAASCLGCDGLMGVFENRLYVTSETPEDQERELTVVGDAVITRGLDAMSVAAGYLHGSDVRIGRSLYLPVTDFIVVSSETEIYIFEGVEYAVRLDAIVIDTGGEYVAIGNVNGESYSLASGESIKLSNGVIFKCLVAAVGKTGEPDYARFVFGPTESFTSCSNLMTDSEGKVICGISESTPSLDCTDCDGRFVNVAGDTMTGMLSAPYGQFDNLTTQSVSSAGNIYAGNTVMGSSLRAYSNLYIDSLASCSGKLYTGAEGEVLCGTDQTDSALSCAQCSGTGRLVIGDGSGMADLELYDGPDSGEYARIVAPGTFYTYLNGGYRHAFDASGNIYLKGDLKDYAGRGYIRMDSSLIVAGGVGAASGGYLALPSHSSDHLRIYGIHSQSGTTDSDMVFYAADDINDKFIFRHYYWSTGTSKDIMTITRNAVGIATDTVLNIGNNIRLANGLVQATTFVDDMSPTGPYQYFVSPSGTSRVNTLSVNEIKPRDQTCTVGETLVKGATGWECGAGSGFDYTNNGICVPMYQLAWGWDADIRVFNDVLYNNNPLSTPGGEPGEPELMCAMSLPDGVIIREAVCYTNGGASWKLYRRDIDGKTRTLLREGSNGVISGVTSNNIVYNNDYHYYFEVQIDPHKEFYGCKIRYENV